MIFENADPFRYPGISTSGAIHRTNTNAPTPMLAQGRTVLRESSGGQAQRQVAARTSTHTGASQYGLIRCLPEIARNNKNATNGATYRRDGYFSTEVAAASVCTTRVSRSGRRTNGFCFAAPEPSSFQVPFEPRYARPACPLLSGEPSQGVDGRLSFSGSPEPPA